MKFGILFFE